MYFRDLKYSGRDVLVFVYGVFYHRFFFYPTCGSFSFLNTLKSQCSSYFTLEFGVLRHPHPPWEKLEFGVLWLAAFIGVFEAGKFFRISKRFCLKLSPMVWGSGGCVAWEEQHKDSLVCPCFMNFIGSLKVFLVTKRERAGLLGSERI